MKTLIDEHPSLFLDEIQAQVYDTQGNMLSISTIQLELQARLMITLKKAGVTNVQKDLVAYQSKRPISFDYQNTTAENNHKLTLTDVW